MKTSLTLFTIVFPLRIIFLTKIVKNCGSRTTRLKFAPSKAKNKSNPSLTTVRKSLSVSLMPIDFRLNSAPFGLGFPCSPVIKGPRFGISELFGLTTVANNPTNEKARTLMEIVKTNAREVMPIGRNPSYGSSGVFRCPQDLLPGTTIPSVSVFIFGGKPKFSSITADAFKLLVSTFNNDICAAPGINAPSPTAKAGRPSWTALISLAALNIKDVPIFLRSSIFISAPA